MRNDPSERRGPGRPRHGHASMMSSVKAPDYWRIDLSAPWQVRFWTREFGVSEEQLRKALVEAGDHVGSVRTYLEAGATPRSD
jgi:hypothetical protein